MLVNYPHTHTQAEMLERRLSGYASASSLLNQQHETLLNSLS